MPERRHGRSQGRSRIAAVARRRDTCCPRGARSRPATARLARARVERQGEQTDATDELADELLLPREFLQGTIDLLRERRQVILHGPPGTGKTHLAQHLAWHLTDRSMVRLVQFHPAYSYEDFFEGFRPIASAEGSGVAFRLTPGPLRCLVDAARGNPGLPHVLIIDEINRANLARVFGELYFLLECGCG